MIEEEIEQDEIVNEGSEYSPKSEFSKPKLVYESMQKCIEARSKEMIKGFWNTKITKDGLPIRTWNQDSRQVFIGCVIALKSILSPEILQETDYKTKLKVFEEKIKEAKKTYSYKEVEEELREGRSMWIKTGKTFIPEIGSLVVIRNLQRQNTASQVLGGWDNKVNLYWNIVLEQYDKIFACLNELINKKNYFKQRVSY